MAARLMLFVAIYLTNILNLNSAIIAKTCDMILEEERGEKYAHQENAQQGNRISLPELTHSITRYDRITVLSSVNLIGVKSGSDCLSRCDPSS